MGILIDVVHPHVLGNVGELAVFLRNTGRIQASGLHPATPTQLDQLLSAVRPQRLLGPYDRTELAFTASASAIDALRPLADGSCGSFTLECGDVTLISWPREAWIRAPELDMRTPDHARAFASFRARRARAELRGRLTAPDDVAIERLPDALHAVGDVVASLPVSPETAVALAANLTRSTLTLRADEHTVAWPAGTISTDILAGPDFEASKSAWLARVAALLEG